MGEIVNLRQARKRKAREEAETTASENRIKFGLSRRDKKLAAARLDLEQRQLEAHRREAAEPAKSDDGR